MPNRPRRRARHWMLVAVIVTTGLIAAGCGDGSEAGEGASERVPESGTLPSTTTTEPTETGDETTTTAAGSETTLPLPGSEVGALVEITVVGDEVTVTWTVTGNDPIESRQIQVGINTPITVQVTADRAEEVHVHGYDLKADLAPGVPGTVEFVADTAGIFEIELEQGHVLLAQLEVGA